MCVLSICMRYVCAWDIVMYVISLCVGDRYAWDITTYGISPCVEYRHILDFAMYGICILFNRIQASSAVLCLWRHCAQHETTLCILCAHSGDIVHSTRSRPSFLCYAVSLATLCTVRGLVQASSVVLSLASLCTARGLVQASSAVLCLWRHCAQHEATLCILCAHSGDIVHSPSFLRNAVSLATLCTARGLVTKCLICASDGQ